MKQSLIAILAFAAGLSAQARPFHRPVITPAVETVCVYNLEKETETYDYNRRRWVVSSEFVESFTEYGRSACFMAEEACLRQKVREEQFNYWDKFTCQKDFSSIPRPSLACEYRIETRFGYEPEVYSARGRFACDSALEQCERDLKRKRALGPRNGGVGPRAQCVQTSANRPGPRPVPRFETASCTAAQFFISNNGNRRTNVAPFTATARARSYQEARQRACSEALSQCESMSSGPRFACDVIN